MKENKEAKLTVRLYTQEKEFLKELSEKTGTSISEVIRGLIEDFIAKENNKRGNAQNTI